MLVGGYNATVNITHTTPLIVSNLFLGSTVVGQGLVDTVATAPTNFTIFAHLADAPSATINPDGIILDLEGSFILPPGGYLGVAPLNSTAANQLLLSMAWEEVPR